MKHKSDGADALPRVTEQCLCVINRQGAGSISNFILKTKAECPELLNETSFSLNWASKYEWVLEEKWSDTYFFCFCGLGNIKFFLCSNSIFFSLLPSPSVSQKFKDHISRLHLIKLKNFAGLPETMIRLQQKIFVFLALQWTQYQEKNHIYLLFHLLFSLSSPPVWQHSRIPGSFWETQPGMLSLEHHGQGRENYSVQAWVRSADLLYHIVPTVSGAVLYT